MPRPAGCPTDHELTISMVDDLVLVRVDGQLDQHRTEALVMCVAGATSTRATVLIDLDGSGIPSHRPCISRTPTPINSPRPANASVPSPGYVQLDLGDRTWTIDLTSHRYCQSARPVTPAFVDPRHWTPLRQIWVTADRTAVHTYDDTLVTSRATWNGSDSQTWHRHRPSDRRNGIRITARSPIREPAA